MNSPRHDASASQHISTSTQPTTNNNITTNTTKTATVNNQQQMHSHTQHQATTATTVPRIDARACAQKIRSQEQHGNSVAASGDLGSALPPSGLEQQKRTRVTPKQRWSINNSESLWKLFNFWSCAVFFFNENVLFVSVFSECVAASRNMNLSHFSICAHRTCLISQHCMTDADSLHNRHVEFARGGAVNGGSFW